MRGKRVPITNMQAQCPYCKQLAFFRLYTKDENAYYFFRLYTKDENAYYFMTQGQYKEMKTCEHYTNHFRDYGGMVARFHRQGRGY